LPDDLPDLTKSSANQAIGKTDSLLFINGKTHEDLGIIEMKPKVSVMADRNVLRKMLVTNLDVQYGKYLTGYKMEDGGVTAEFKDDTNARGTILVGADGSNSIIRSQLLEGFKAVRSKYIMFNADIKLSKDQYEPVLAKSNNGILFGEPGLKGALLIGEWLADETGLFHWDCAYLGDDSDQNHTWSEQASRDELYDRAVNLTAQLPDYVVDIIKRTGPEGMLKPPVKLVETVLPVDSLPDGPVTLVGDAAHSMVPFNVSDLLVMTWSLPWPINVEGSVPRTRRELEAPFLRNKIVGGALFRICAMRWPELWIETC
jgi:2-polyprenyl-6-methoxyphenol hydroxylase-like FAD-dependent oxidoreductase